MKVKRTLAPGLLALLLAGCATVPAAERSRAEAERGRTLRGEEKLDAALAAYEKALELDPTNLLALRGYVESAQKLGRLDAAGRRFSAAVERAPGDAYAREGLGLVLYARGDGERAREQLAKAAELAPQVADFHYRLGVLLVESDRYAEAREALGKAVAGDPAKVRYRLPYAAALARAGDRAGAVAQLREVLKRDATPDELRLAEQTAQNVLDPFRSFPAAAREQFELALRYLDSDQPAKARELFEALLDRFPDLAVVHALDGLCAARTDEAGRAIASLRKAMELDPLLAEPHLYLADLYFARGRPDQARDSYLAALERNPFLADAHRRLAEAQVKANEPDAAAERYGIYQRLRPDDYDAAAARAVLLSERGKAEAGGAWDVLVERFPRRPEALVGRGKWYFVRAANAADAGERDRAHKEAAKSLEAALELDPENATAAETLRALRGTR